MAKEKAQIVYANGDGIGPEIMAATLHVLKESGAPLEFRQIEIGEKVYLEGEPTGIHSDTWDVIRKSDAFLKAPITTPQGGGFKSLNVTVRTSMGLYANVRPCVSYAPFIDTKHPKMDVVIVRENEEDLYAGIEYRQSPEMYHALKLISRPGCEKIIRYAFDYARANGRKKVTCFTKDNILKLTDGEFHKIYEEIAKEYPEIENEHWIIDIGAAKLAASPELFDVIVMPNLYGDILSDIAAQITGSVGLAGSANIGVNGAMFEAIHGSAPRRAGQNAANPSGLLLASVMMLVHLGYAEEATSIHNAWLRTIEDGVHTYDIFKEGVSKQSLGTKEFAQAVVDRLGKTPETLPKVAYQKGASIAGTMQGRIVTPTKKELVGVDVFVEAKIDAEELQKKIIALVGEELSLTMIANRGVMVWPQKQPETFCTDSWRCRFMAPKKGMAITHGQVANLLGKLAAGNVDFLQTQHLYTFDGKAAYTVAQNEQ